MAHLLVLHQGALGDFLLALSVIQSARTAVHADHVSAIASAPSARLAAGRSAIDTCIYPDAAALHSLFGDTTPDPRLSAVLADADVILNFLSVPTDPLHARLQQLSPARVISIDPRPTASTLTSHQHITTQWTAAIRAQNLSIGDPTPPLLAPSAKRGVIASECSPSPATLESAGDPPLSAAPRNPKKPRHQRSAFSPEAPQPPKTSHLLIHPGSGGLSKCWPLDRFLALAESLHPAEIHWLLGPAEIDSAPARFAPLNAHCSARRQPLHIEHDLEAAAALMSTADLYIGNDAGATQLAAALRSPTIAIFGPTDPAIWRPLGDHVHIVAPPAPAPIDSVPLAAVLATVRSSCSPLP